MIGWSRFRSWAGELAGLSLCDDSGAQLVEFAVALPLLVFFVIGIFDFSNAFTFKQKLTNITRDAARAAASDPANDLQSYSTVAPASVIDAFYDIDNYLIANNINDCGISGSSPSPSGVLTWTYTASGNGCPTGGLTIIINRGYYFPQPRRRSLQIVRRRRRRRARKLQSSALASAFSTATSGDSAGLQASWVAPPFCPLRSAPQPSR